MPSAPKVPKTPSPADTAAAQILVNRQGALDFATLSNISQSTPYGQLNQEILGYDQNGLPIRRVNTNLSPEQQGLLNLLQGTQGQAGQAGQNLLTMANYGGGLPDFSNEAGGRVEANLARMQQYWNPIFGQQSEQLDNQLRNQGLMPGTQAYDRAMRTLQTNQGQTVSQFLATQQPQAFNQAVASYQAPFEMAKNLATLGQPANLPGSFVQPPQNQQFTPPNMGQLQSNANQANQFAYNAQLAQQQALMSGLATTGTALLPFLLSDEEMKRDIEPIGKTFDKQTIYRYKYKGDPSNTTHIGMLAQEIEEISPRAVRAFGGTKYVDYHAATNKAARRGGRGR